MCARAPGLCSRRTAVRTAAPANFPSASPANIDADDSWLRASAAGAGAADRNALHRYAADQRRRGACRTWLPMSRNPDSLPGCVGDGKVCGWSRRRPGAHHHLGRQDKDRPERQRQRPRLERRRSALARMLLMVRKLASIDSAVTRKALMRPRGRRTAGMAAKLPRASRRRMRSARSLPSITLSGPTANKAGLQPVVPIRGFGSGVRRDDAR